MKIIEPKAEIVSPLDGKAILRHIETCGRVCYKSEEKTTDESAPAFVKGIIARGHESVLEHFAFTVRFTCDRGVSHEIVRHRLASYSQESTRYCNYSKGKFGAEITVVKPCFFPEDGDPFERYQIWKRACQMAEDNYFDLLRRGATPQEARSALPNSLKTEVVMTANLREWRHFFRLRTGKAAHPQMREITIPLLRELKTAVPVVFDDIEVEE